MKTTLELPDPLLRRAKTLAATRGITLKQLVTEALQQRLDAERVRPAWRSLSGRLAMLRTETARVMDRVDAEFEGIDDEEGA